ncbi:SDR family NAD(P)-dependent oxidoreductase [Actinocorallia populi]|uniref:SDR family NAD(P)-dependent oxidoreductase n=1 Tax=Actinocorallia populi TaxID=2079200 RepID=UPI000D0933AF|nr:SDR family oxidoreductase [Actinocorallia populi]
MWRDAVVTGASSGIGESIARSLAAQGTDLVLVARRGDLLERLAAELSGRFGVRAEALAADLTSADGLERVAGRVPGTDLLVNNAGYGAFGAFHTLSYADRAREVGLNVTALTRLTHAAVPSMAERGRGGVLNVASVAAYAPSPGSAVYGATKAFVLSFTESLHAELKPAGVHVTALCPGFTRTEDDQPTNLMWMARDTVARAGLEAVRRNHALCVPGVRYRLLLPAMKIAPRGVLRTVSTAVWNTAVRTHGSADA